MNLTITDDMIIKFVTGGNEYIIDKMVLNDNGTDYEIYDGGSTPAHDYSQDYFTIESLEDGNTITFTKGGGAPANTFYYSLDDGATWTSSNATISWTLQSGDNIKLKATANAWNTSGNDYYAWKFSSTNRYNVYGNIMSLLYGDNFTGQTTLSNNYAFSKLFSKSSNLVNAVNLILPATTLTYGCYKAMFEVCSSMITPPVLPATTLADWCYGDMFYSCTSLTTAPELPATTLVASCYAGMFTRCSNLNFIKCLATSISASNCLYNWVNSVAASGTFIKDPNMNSWSTGNAGIPSGWTVENAA